MPKKADASLWIQNEKGLVFGPCGACAFYRQDETPEQHTTGRCHGAPPNGAQGWPVVHGDYVGCAVYQAAK